MPIVETESLVLKSHNLAEADRIVVFFTREHGVVRGVAKGAKRMKSRFGSALEPFSTVQLEYFQKEDRELVSIQRVELIASSFEAASEPQFLQTFSYIADLLIAFVPPHDRNETLYRMVKSCLKAACASPENLQFVRLYFELWLLRLAGYLPEWKRCRDCERDFEKDEAGDLQADFHILCKQCRRSQGAKAVTGPQREVFQKVQELAPAEFAVIASNRSDDLTEVSEILKRIISNVLGREVAGEKSFAVNFQK